MKEEKIVQKDVNTKQVKKLRQIYNKDLKIKYKNVLNHFINNKPWYIPKKLWIYWLTK